MENAPVIIFVGALVFLAHLFVALFEKTRVPDVLYLILIGLIIGPILHFATPKHFGVVGEIFTTVALVVILFESGLQMSFAALRSALRGTMILTIVTFSLAWAFLTAAIYALLGTSFPIALFSGAALAGPAPAVVIPLVKQLKLQDASRTTLTLESALGEALCLVVGLGILRAVELGAIDVGPMIGQLMSSFLFAILIGGGGGYAWSLLLHRTRRLQHAIFLTPSFVFIVFGLSEFLGFSGPVAALCFGVVLGNAGLIRIPWLTRKTDLEPIQHSEIEKLFFGEIVFLLKTFFFVYLGLSIQISDLNNAWVAFALTGVLLVVRIISVRVSTDPHVTTQSDASIMSVMIPKGLATAVLASLPFHLGLPGGEMIQTLVYSVVFVSIITTGGLVFLVERTSFGTLLKRLFSGYLSDPLPPTEEPASTPP